MPHLSPKLLLLALVVVALSGVVVGCQRTDGPGNEAPDAGSDADTDADTDVDADGDGQRHGYGRGW